MPENKNIFDQVFRSFLYLAGTIFFIYGILVLLIIGPYRIFNFFYLASGIILLVLACFWKNMSKAYRKILTAFLLIAAICFIATETMIIGYAMRKPQPEADYVIILGSQIRSDGPSIDYKARLDSAIAYWNDNKESRIICTGAKGSDEPLSEAQGGFDYLTKKGIPADKILIEDESRNTEENLQNAFEIIKKEGKDPTRCKIVIVSASYHLFRASYLAKRIGYDLISCRGGHGLLILQPHYYTREFFALGKEILNSFR